MTEQLTDACTLIESLRQIAHDVRQPLSGIENIAYILGMSSSEKDPKTIARLEQLRHLVEQANWILEDALETAQIPDARIAKHDLCPILRSFAAEVSLRGDRSLRLHLPSEPVVVSMDRQLTERMLHWVLHFGVSVAQSSDSPQIRCVKNYGRARVTITLTPGERDVSVMAELIDPRGRSGYLRTVATAQQMSVTVGDSGSGGLAIELDYPLA